MFDASCRFRVSNKDYLAGKPVYIFSFIIHPGVFVELCVSERLLNAIQTELFSHLGPVTF